jgi:ATP-binding cassette, subfamily G (WHITE), member 2, SNQ2
MTITLTRHRIILFPAVVINAVIPKFYTNLALWSAREFPSRIYNWFAFSTAMIVAEIPIATLCAVIYWVCPVFLSSHHRCYHVKIDSLTS